MGTIECPIAGLVCEWTVEVRAVIRGRSLLSAAGMECDLSSDTCAAGGNTLNWRLVSAVFSQVPLPLRD